ncbi:uncharacterized protein K02A2.6-like [Strongylocentrotus purpuratus]|uniref:RNA-directed DNA polymerase n=1 Tax=Strongylocentrotus purpuratus TaxID=7668 RepID=A0A7M7PF91_STRPU|nr:uncharacterized protein K02A2.6-like [Strongylocentrotus purpuratus]
MNLPQFERFPVHEDPTNVGVRWEKYMKRMENFFTAFQITDDAQKRALLLHYAGPEVSDIFDTLPGTGTDFKGAKDALDKHFSPALNVEYERFVFRQCKQSTDETVEQYHLRLQQLSATCKFANTSSEVKSQIIMGCTSSKLRRYALREEVTLQKLLMSAKTFEQADRHATAIEANSQDAVQAVKYQPAPAPATNTNRFQQSRNRSSRSSTKCRNCGGAFPHKQDKPCPAKGKQCHSCGKMNHFAKYCRSKPCTPQKTIQASTHTSAQSTVDDTTHDPDGDAYAFQFNINSKKGNKPMVMVSVDDNEPLSALIDTGSSVMMMSNETFSRLRSKPHLVTPSIPVYAYGSSTPLDVIGTFHATVRYKSKSTKAKVFVTSHNGDTLLDITTATDLDLIALTYNLQPEQTYADRFSGIGKLANYKCHLHVDRSVQPVAVPHRRIPFHLRKQVESELDKLQKLDVIEPVSHTPTPWVSPITVVQKRNREDIRICVDMRNVNKAVIRERHVMPTVDDLISALNGATTFSKMDLNSGYHQLELDEDSRQYTVFSTHAGLYRYKRLNFGVSSASEIFQHAIQATLHDLPGVLNISDDILVFGTNKAEHNARLEAVLKRLREVNLTLNQSKCVFNTDHVEYFGHVFSAKGISPDPKKVEAIQSMPAPQNVSEVRSFLGMVNYCARFIPGLASVSAPLRHLTKADSEWEWGTSQADAFAQIKQRVSQSCTMAYFNPASKTELIVDASPHGLGALLVQHDDHDNTVPVALASRALTEVEQRYSQTEREALAITWAIIHFHVYLYGGSFVVTTDHKPLVTLFNSPTAKPPLRLERWILKLQPYDFNVQYRPGKHNPADYMSRHPLSTEMSSSDNECLAEAHVSFVAGHAVPKTTTLSDITAATKQDPVLQVAIDALVNDNWKDVLAHATDTKSELQSLFNVRDELTVSNERDFLLRGNRIVIPQSLRQQIIDIAHEGHQGITKTKSLLREKVWFPSIDRMTEKTVRDCLTCQTNTIEHSKEPLLMSPLPKKPWSEISVDFADLPTGEHLLVVIDDYSRFPEVKLFPLLPLDKRVTPRWPQANGEVERFMKTLKKAYRSAIAENRSWKQELYKFLRNYRATPHSTTGVPPATLLFGRAVRTRLPEHASSDHQPLDGSLRSRDHAKKERMKTYADSRGTTRSTEIKDGDTVLVRRDGLVPKHQSPYLPQPYTVIRKRGTRITARCGNHYITRNSSRFKRYCGPLPRSAPDDDEIDFDIALDARDVPQPPRLSSINCHLSHQGSLFFKCFINGFLNNQKSRNSGTKG